METINDGYMMLLDSLMMKGVTLGDISTDGLDFGGDDPTVIELKAAQKRNAPVKKVISDGGKDTITFQMIQMVAQHLKDVMGGTVNGEKYLAPGNKEIIEGEAFIKTGTGQTLHIIKATLMATLRGKLGSSGNLYANCTLEIMSPDDGSSPYEIYPTVPAVVAEFENLTFKAAGESKLVRISASGDVVISGLPTGYTIAQEGNYLMITAPANSGTSEIDATLTIKLASDNTVSTTIAIVQPHE